MESGITTSYKKMNVTRLLLVGSEYDAYLLQLAGFRRTGRQMETTHRYHASPEYEFAETGAAALRRIAEVDFDLVLCDLSFPDMKCFELADRIRQLGHTMPVILLTSKRDYGKSWVYIPGADKVSSIFVWVGSTDILNAIIWYCEDLNIITRGDGEDFKYLLVVEDEPLVFSKNLPIVYSLIMKLSEQFILPVCRDMKRVIDHRLRVALATSWEGAMEFVEVHGEQLAGVITDVEFPRDGQVTPRLGIELLAELKARRPGIPVIVNSSNRDYKEEVEEGDGIFIWKQSPMYRNILRGYMMKYFGFGDFYFRTADGRIAGRCGNIKDFIEDIGKVPDESLAYHARNHHFSSWFYIHGAYEVSSAVKALPVDHTFRARFTEVLTEFIETFCDPD